MPRGKLKGLAHITGGGLIDNLPRILPNDCDAVIETASWKVPAIFQILQERGGVDRDEMYQVFNMGIGMAAIVAPNDVAAGKQLRAKVIGRIEDASEGGVGSTPGSLGRVDFQEMRARWEEVAPRTWIGQT